MSSLLHLAKRPPVTTHRAATALEASDTMMRARAGAVIVLDEGRLVGIVSERDIVTRVVVPRRDPSQTLVSEIMTREVHTGTFDLDTEEAMQIMSQGNFRHLPLVDASRRVVAILSMRHVLRARVEELASTSERLINYFSADGPGG